ncbi:MAG TPA: hypothetical protein VLF68_01310 [Candidatus Saccharimonadales bacterium]|nr:hypothetical protein [Candidatus Saccharimonadales bacterium]
MHLLSLAVPGENGGVNIPAPSGVPTGGLEAGGTGQKILQVGVELFLIAAVVFALFMLIFGGIGWISSSGDKQKIASARNRIIYAIIGLVVVLLSFFILTVLGNIFGVKFFGF